MTDAGTIQDNFILPAPPVGRLPLSQDWLGRMKLVHDRTVPKQRANNKIMISLLTEDRSLVETQDEILKETTNFYKRLYTSEKTDVLAQDYLLKYLKQTLTDEYKDSIEGEITLNEILIAIKSLANEKREREKCFI